MENKENQEATTNTEKKSGINMAGLAKGLGNIAATAKAVAEKAQDAISNAVDVTGDGKIDAEDFSKMADDAGKGIKRGGELLSKAAADIKLAADLKQLRPVFPADLLPLTAAPGTVSPIQIINRPEMIRIVGRDKRRDENDACVGAIGYWTLVKGMDILNIYEDRARSTGLQFYPNTGKTFYYADPCQPNFYIALDEYFPYMKKARVSELEMVAKNLGAKKFSIVFKEQRKTIVAKTAKGSAKANAMNTEASYTEQTSDIANINIAAQSQYSGHDNPVQPKLVYFGNESDITNLIEMRMDASEGNQIQSKTYSIQFNKSSGIKAKEAASIDMVLGQLKCGGTATLSSEAENESRIILEYSIEF